MAGKISIECPSCSAKLNVSDRSKLGKKIKCPKCQEIFAPEVPEEVDDVDDYDDEPDDKPIKSKAPLKRGGAGGKKSSGKSSKGSSSGGGSNVALIGGGIVVLILLGGVGLFASGVFSGKAPPMNPGAAPSGTVAAAPQAAATAPAIAAPPGVQSAHSQMSPSPSSISRAPVAATPPPSTMTPAEKALGLRWMTPNIEMIIHAKVSDIWQAPLLKGPLSDPSVSTFVDETQKKFGVKPSDIESVTTGIGNISESFNRGIEIGIAGMAGGPNGPNFNPGNMPPAKPEDQHFVAVFKTKTAVDLKKIMSESPGSSMKEKNGKSYLEMGLTASGGAWSPDSKTLIFATTKELLEIMEKGESQIPRKEFSAIDHLPQVVIAVVMPELSAETNKTGLQLPPQFNEFIEAAKPYQVRLACIGLTIRGGIDLQVSALSGTDEGSKKIKSDIETNLSLVKSQFEFYKKSAPPLLAELGEVLLANLKIEEQNRTVKISTNVPDSAQSQLEQLPPTLMMMAMTGGLPGMGVSGGGSSMGNGAGGLGAMKQPGETESVASTKMEGLPEGLTLSAKTAWSRFPVVTAGGTQAIPVEILFDVTGDGLDAICASTGVSPKTMKLDGGTKLKAFKQISVGDGDPQKAFVPYDATDEFSFFHPPQTLRVRFSVDAPTGSPKNVEVIEGSFKILLSKNSEEFTIEEAPKRALRPLAGAEFKAAELKLRRKKESIPEMLTLWCGKDHFIGQVKGSPEGTISITEFNKDQTVQRLYSNHEGGNFPDDFQIKFKLYSKVEEHEVTFRFENVPLPAVESKPQFQTQTNQ